MSLASYYARVLQDAFGDESGTGDEPVATHDVARGDSFLDDGNEAALKSELPGVSDECWTQFCRTMATAKPSDVSPSNGLGMFELTPRRLADLGVLKKLKRAPSNGKMIWLAIFVPPMTSDRFLNSPKVQYACFAKSMRSYADKIKDGEINKEPDMPLSGALAILHRAGPSGLETWKNGERFDQTKQQFDSVSGVF